ncbi:glycosyltransferase [Mycolicibacterium pulveris]|uniref:glycosyltransferase n=1 Tax=Mycolicibacterium pulveris TaxID=36813 RepID=UPI003CED32E6
MAQHIFVVIAWVIAGICMIAVIYPYVVYPLVLSFFRFRPIRMRDIGSDRGREFALLFCAYNEAKALPEKIANLRELRAAYPDLEILAYDDCSDDGSADLLESAGLGIRVARGRQRSGKAHGMKLLAASTNREFLVFTDANVALAAGALHRLCAVYADPAVGGVCGVLKYIDAAGSPAAHAGGLYWRLEEHIKALESRSGNVMGADGSIFSVRSRLYPDFPDTVLDDMTVSMAVIFQGQRLVKDSHVVAYERLVTGRHDDFRRRMRIAMRSFHTHIWFRGELRAMGIGDRWRWWSHRYLRWQGGSLLIAGSLAALLALVLSAHWLALIACIVAAAGIALAGTYLRLGALSTVVHLIASILLTGVGVFRAQTGHTMATWKPPAR